MPHFPPDILTFILWSFGDNFRNAIVSSFQAVEMCVLFFRTNENRAIFVELSYYRQFLTIYYCPLCVTNLTA